MHELTLTVEQAGIRLDRYLADHTDLSRSRIQTLCEQGAVTVNGKPAKRSLKLAEGDVIAAEVPEDEPLDVKAENIPLDILYEDSDIIVINKPKGMVVHPAAGVYTEHWSMRFCFTARIFPESTACFAPELSTGSIRIPLAASLPARMIRHIVKLPVSSRPKPVIGNILRCATA